MKFDILIKNARIIDGTNTPWYKGDIGIINDRIEFIGKSIGEKTNIVIDANEKFVCPGFIDSHTHFDLGPFSFLNFQDHLLKRRLYQGITTQITGCCGCSAAPVTEKNKIEWLIDYGINNTEKIKWNDYGEYLDELSKQELGTNYIGYVGHGTIRFNVLGFSDRKPNREELEEMKSILRKSLKEGAIGMSTGLIYPPGVFADTEELIELSNVLSEFNAIYASHIRNESNDWINSVKEVIEIAEKNNITGIVHHMKVKSPKHKELVKECLDIVYEARNRGVDITFEQYPYEASWTGLSAILPSWTFEGGNVATLKRLRDKSISNKIKEEIFEEYGWKNHEDELEGSKKILIVEAKKFEDYIGKTLYEISEIINKSPIDAAIEILIGSNLNTSAAYFGISEECIKTILSSPLTMIGSDSGPSKIGGGSHPRNNGTFPRILGKYVREENIISWENAVFKMTGFPASKFNLINRGLIKQGMFADIVIFDPKIISDGATYIDPFEKPKGIDYVIVNGCISIQNSEFTGNVDGKVINRQ